MRARTKDSQPALLPVSMQSSTTPSATSLPTLVNELAKNDASSEEALFGAAQADVATKKEVESWLGNIESEDKEVTDLKVSQDRVIYTAVKTILIDAQ